MAYIGNYMRGDYVNADNSAPSIIGLQQYIQQGFNAGRAQGQNQQLAQLSQAAYNDTGDQQSQDVSKAIGIDPSFGYKLGATVGAQSAAQQHQTQLKRYGGVASAIFQAKQAGNDAGAEGLYQSVLPELSAMAAKNGGSPPPANLDAALADPKISGTMYQLAQMYGAGLPQPQKGVVIAPGGQLVNPQTGVKMAAVPNRGQVVGGYYFDPATGTASPIPIQGAPNGTGMAAPVQGNPQGAAPGLDTTVPGTNGQGVTFNFTPGTPPEVIAAVKASAVANGDIAPGTQVGAEVAPQATQGQPQTLAGALASHKAATTAGAIPSGFQWNADHTKLEPMPGGPEDPMSNPFDLTPDAVSNAAWNMIFEGKMPNLGRSKEALHVRATIMNKVADIAKQAGVTSADLATQAGRTKALQASLQNLQKQSDVMEKSENTFLNNANVLLDLSDKVSRSGVPAFNKFLLHVKTDYSADPDAAAFLTARNLVAQEYAKIASSATGAAGSSDTSQNHALELINTAQTPAQLRTVIATLEKDINGQKQSTEQQLLNISARMQQFGAAKQYPGHAFEAGGQQSPQSGPAPSGVDSLLSKYGIQ